MIVVLLWRPEERLGPDEDDVFDGMSVFATYPEHQEKEVEQFINELADEHPDWRFHIDTVSTIDSVEEHRQTINAFKHAVGVREENNG